MLWKDIKFSIRKYYIYVLMPAIFIMFFTKFNAKVANTSPDVLKVAIISNDKMMSQYIENTQGAFKISYYVEDLANGYKIVENKNDVDAFVFYDEKSKIIKVVENKSTTNSKYVGSVLKQILNKTDFQIKYIGEYQPDINNMDKFKYLLNSFTFILTFVCILLPYKMFVDEKKTLSALILSPIKNYEIIFSKTICTILLFSIDALFFYVSQGISIKEIILLFLVGLIYISLGMFMGIFSDSKKVSVMFYPFMFIVMIFPSFLTKPFNKLSNAFYNAIENNWIFVLDMLILLIVFSIMILIVNYIFMLKLRRERI
ncbi:ABC transporter permease [Clostridium sp. BJN0013]|uniref:ABC transporter permease n=1 Tax=Clostridium sp. BJN0013 TaxID=3236840 RepID=UPI0034C69395